MSLFNSSKTESSRVTAYDLPHFAENEQAIKSEVAGPYRFISLEESRAGSGGSLENARGQAEKVLKKAHDEAGRLRAEVAELKRKAEEERAQARDVGHKEGYAAGLEAGNAACRTEAGSLLIALKKVGDLYQDLWKTQEAVLVKLAGRIAEKVIFQEASISTEVLASAFKAALDQLGEQHQAVFHLHPEDITVLEGMGSEIRHDLSGLVNISYQPDPKLSRGDVVMETEAGRLDGTLQHRLNAVMGPVEEALKARFDLDW